MGSCISTWNAALANSPANSRISPACTIHRPTLRTLSSSRFTWAATRFTVSTRPTRAPPGNTGIERAVPGTSQKTRKLRTYASTAAREPIRTWASVHATTSTIRSARQTMLTCKDARASQARTANGLVRGDMDAFHERDELLASSADRSGIAEHLDEQGSTFDRRERDDHPSLLLAVAREVIDVEWTCLALHRRAQGRDRGLIDGREAELAAPAIDVGEVAARRARQHRQGDLDVSGDGRLEARGTRATGHRSGPTLGQRPGDGSRRGLG